MSIALLVVAVLTVLTVYQSKGYTKDQNMAKTEENQQEEAKKDTNQSVDSEEDTQDVQEESTDVSTSDVEAVKESQDTEEVNTGAQDAKSEEDGDSNLQTETEQDTTETAQTTVEPTLDFTEETLLQWPVSGSVLMDYSMDKAVYFSTLDEYKYNPALIISAQIEEPVAAVANSKVLSIEENAETGNTLTMDMGNGYYAIYGQLKDISVTENQIVAAGTQIGTISEPTKYYTKEGLNLYFAMTKDDTNIDPIVYLP